MGGDHAPAAVVAGALRAARHHQVRITLVGCADAVRAELDQHPDAAALGPGVLDAPDVVAMNESPLVALRRKRRASIVVATELVKAGQAQAVFSAGHTGAAVLAAHQAFGLLHGVDRPALAVTVPTRTSKAGRNTLRNSV
jgi:glycerol-3-phosphate acyltransferase PlsX